MSSPAALWHRTEWSNPEDAPESFHSLLNRPDLPAVVRSAELVSICPQRNLLRIKGQTSNLSVR